MIRPDSRLAPTVALTFDDAVSNHATLVAPLLKEYGFGATFFVTEFEGAGTDRFSTDKRQYMTWEQIRELDRLGFEIGHHTGTHRPVTGLGRPELLAELRQLDARFSEHGIQRPTSFAYPNGAFDSASVEVLRDYGFLRARIVSNRPYLASADDVLLIPSYSTCDAHPARFDEALAAVPADGAAVLTLHGVPDYNHPWVSTEPGRFRQWLDILQARNCRVTALRDL